MTGEMDPVTVELMGTPRCGVSDKKKTDKDRVNLGLSGAYVLQGSRWQVKQLSYRLGKHIVDTSQIINPE